MRPLRESLSTRGWVVHIEYTLVLGRGGRVVEGARLESVYTVCPVSRVRIPLSPPAVLQDSAITCVKASNGLSF